MLYFFVNNVMLKYIKMEIKFNGQTYLITNWDEFSEKLLTSIGFQLENEIVQQINKERLVDTGQFKRSLNIEVINNELIVSSDAPYAKYIEYGTAGRKKGVVDPFGESSSGPNPTRKMPLTEELKAWASRHGFDNNEYFALAKSIQENGTEPRAPFRKVWYNDQLMARAINNSFKMIR